MEPAIMNESSGSENSLRHGSENSLRHGSENSLRHGSENSLRHGSENSDIWQEYAEVICPHCNVYLHIKSTIREPICRIFRHGIRKADGKQMDQRAPKDVCDRLVKYDGIIGCGKPFRTVFDSCNNVIAVSCNYI